MRWAFEHEPVVLTNDLDFSAILAASRGAAPSVVQLRMQDLLPAAAGSAVRAALDQFADVLHAGALLTIDPQRARARVLPLR